MRASFQTGLAALCFLLATPALAETLLIQKAWSPQAPPGRVMAGYMLIENTGNQSVSLVEAHSPRFKRVEFHTVQMDDGVMRMRRLDQLVVPSGGHIELKSGGHHLMLFEPIGSFSANDQYELNLIDDSGRRHRVTVDIGSR